MRSKHILVISQYFYPESFRINDMCREWIRRGYRVSVVTGIPNYPQGKFYPGYGWFKRRTEVWDGINIIRLPLIARGKSSVTMALNFLSFVVSGFFWSKFTGLKADLVFTYEVSPMTQALLGVWYAKRKGIRHYLYVQDLWPENIETVAGIHSPVIIKPISAMVDYIYNNCHRIFATSPSFVREIQKRVKGETQKVTYWPQYAEDFYRPLPRPADSVIADDGTFKIVFTGNIGQAQGLEILPHTARELKNRGRADVRFVIVGDGRQKKALLEQIRSQDVGDLFCMIDRKPAEEIPQLLAACDMAFVSFSNDPLFAKTIPAKLQSYMACGMPILASACGETRRVIEEARCGKCCDLGCVDGLTAAILELKDADLTPMAENARAYFERFFRRDMLLDEMDRFFTEDSLNVKSA